MLDRLQFESPREKFIWTAGPAEPFSTGEKVFCPSELASVNGVFNKGASVEIKSDTNQVLGKGLVNYSSTDIACIMGHRSDAICNVLQLSRPYAEVIHRDNLAITYEQDEVS